MEQVDYAAFLPKTPPDGMIDWLSDGGYFDDEYIVYKQEWCYNPLIDRNERMAECHCSSCGETFYLLKVSPDCCCSSYSRAPFGFLVCADGEEKTVISGDKVNCPMCGKQVYAIHTGEFKYSKVINDYYPMSMHRINNNLAIVTWRITRRLDKNGNTEICSNMYEAYVVLDRKIVKCVGYRNNLGSISWFNHWEQRQKFSDTFGEISARFIYPFKADEILCGTSAENSHLDKYISDCEVSVYGCTDADGYNKGD